MDEIRLSSSRRTLYCWLLIFIFFCLPNDSSQGPNERRLINDLMRDYNVLERPVANESDPLLLSFGLTLQQLIDVDEKNQLLIANIWLSLEWVDVNLRWNPVDYNNIKDIRLAAYKIWRPDVLMYNSADDQIDSTYKTNVVVRHNGSCTYIPPGIFKSTCKIDITWFPFDDQKCEMKFGSWTYDGGAIDLRLASNEGDLSAFISNGEWELIEVPGKRNVIYYACCPDPYVDITFVIHIRRRTLYYGFNLIVPCVLISSMALLGFTLPPDSGEKLTLGVTILLSLMVFLLQLAETMPPTSDAVSIIGTYFACIMMMVAFSVVMTVVVLNYHHRSQDTHEMPAYIKTLFLVWLPKILRMRRHGKYEENKKSQINNKIKELQLKERCSRSLLANVLDIDDDFRLQNSTSGYLHVASTEETPIPHSCIHTQRELNSILKELRFITSRMKEEDEANDIVAEWKFAAMVVDRVCLIIFSLFAIISTCVCLLQAPHLVA
ncbi:neuronal acetylcholine receptor subunit alpha-7-like isoform X1 [Limulus polyphemus]|uniref:Neuronal acetylcholine receptor subunit alpha-7-like isoform X1 n=1 Tax=Limulus polyphemus TaxID=6850 RepID=A0ABM1TS09_LIMPO|nr:neuronal acetylcholine receptor subunit alpha-7-like isoform X1 [Limulus polyphemus]